MLKTSVLPCLLTTVFALLPNFAMGYDLHIIKSSDWTTSSKDPIAEDQWKTVVATDPELRMDPTVSASNPRTGELIQITDPLMASWVDAKSGDKHYFSFRAGQITVKNPSDPAIRKMKDIAAKLGAKVQGDEGEFY